MRRATSGEDQSTAQISAVNPTQEVKIVRASVSFFHHGESKQLQGHMASFGCRIQARRVGYDTSPHRE